MPALRQMSPRQHRAFRAQVEALMIADQQLSLFEYTLRCVLHRHLDAQFLPRRQTRPVHSSLQKLAQPVATILALLAWEGQPEPDQAARAFDTGVRGYLGGDHTHRLPPREGSLAEFPANAQSIRPGHQAPARRRLRCLHPGEPAGHRPRSGAAPRHLRYTRLPASAARRGGNGRTTNDIAIRRSMTDATGRLPQIAVRSIWRIR
jgi:hypothetical protein